MEGTSFCIGENLTPTAEYSVNAILPKYVAVNGNLSLDIRCCAIATVSWPMKLLHSTAARSSDLSDRRSMHIGDALTVDERAHQDSPRTQEQN